MEWKTYQETYRNFEFSVAQTMVVALMGKGVLKEWPTSIPERIREPLVSSLDQMSKLWGDRFDNKISKEEMDTEFDRILTEQDQLEDGGALFRFVLMMQWDRPMGSKMKDIDFTRILNSQALVMLFAHLDAFVGDTLRAICRVRPEVLKSERTIQWEEVVSSGTWDKLIDHLIEKYTYEFGLKPLRKRLEFFKERIGIEGSVKDESLALLEKAEEIRHIIMHNGGSVSQEYLKRTGRQDVGLGEIVPVNIEFLKEVRREVFAVGWAVFEATGKKFFGQETVSTI